MEMDKNKIEEFALELIEEINQLSDSLIWEYSGEISDDLKKLELQIIEYKKRLYELIK